MKFVEFLNEVAAKDWDRMSSLIKKNSDGAGVARTIKSKEKAIDRFVAGLKLTDSELTKPPFKGEFEAFGNRAIELGATYEEIKKVFDATSVDDADKPKEDNSWTPKQRTSSSEPNHRIRAAAILSIGTISLKTGKSRYFNVYEEWGEDNTYEIWETETGRYRIVSTHGKKPTADIGDRSAFKEDQTGRAMSSAKLVDWATGTELKKLAKHYGGTISAFVYK